MAILDFIKSLRVPETLEVPIFPLNTVLFPGSILPLKVFEQRYMDMTKVCLRDNKPFGVCLIKEGRKVGMPAHSEKVGCLAVITDWDMQQLGVFQLKTLGTRRLSITSQRVGANGLISAQVELLPDEPESSLPPEHAACANVLRLIVEKVGSEHFQPPFKFDDAAWVSYRLAEVLPIKHLAKQKLLELNDSRVRLQVLHKFLAEHGLSG